jgi:DnaJ-class molecular chaperone
VSADDESRAAGAGERGGAGPGDEGRSTCTPCRGTGKVISSLTGNEHVVTCPWCGGTGRFQPGRDAQESPAERDTRQPPGDAPESETGSQ